MYPFEKSHRAHCVTDGCVCRSHDRCGIQRPSHLCVPCVHELQNPTVDSRGTDASNAWRVTRPLPRRTQSSKPQSTELQQTRLSPLRHSFRRLLQQHVNEGRPTDADVSVRRSDTPASDMRIQTAPKLGLLDRRALGVCRSRSQRLSRVFQAVFEILLLHLFASFTYELF
jgi:hypothetical protein